MTTTPKRIPKGTRVRCRPAGKPQNPDKVEG